MAIVDAAESLAQNKPSGAEKEAMKAVSGAACSVVRLRLQNASFQHRMIESNAVEIAPGAAIGIRRYQSSCPGLALSIRPASRISAGTSLKNAYNSHTTIGRLLRA